jgi:hypothetical protein
VVSEHGGESRWTLYVPGVYASGKRVTLDQARTAALDVQSLLKLHRAQRDEGRLARVQRFDRSREEQRVLEELDKKRRATMAACGGPASQQVEWSSIDDETLKQYSIATYCGELLEQMRSLCEFRAGRELMRTMRAVRCRFGASPGLTREGSSLTFTVKIGTPNLYLVARRGLRELRDSSTMTLDQRIGFERTDVCLAENNRVVIVAPRGVDHAGVSYGDGTTFYRSEPVFGLGHEWFFDPRQFHPRRNASFRGIDVRQYSLVDVDRAARRCRLMCGERVRELRLAGPEAAERILAGATFKPLPHQREPYALARDSQGKYYFVDRGKQKGSERDFRVFVGQRGVLKQQQMKDIVSDSEGEIFSTANGKLRLVVGKSQAFWITQASRRELLLLPLQENMRLIYSELGPYLKERLGVPCDDL